VYSTEAREIDHHITLAGFLFGAVAGLVWKGKYAPFKMEGSAPQKVGRYIVGIVGLFALYLGLDILFGLFAPDASLAGYILRYIRYSLVSIWAIFGAPWAFLKLKLAESS
jgi:hypothetical protein